MADDLTLPLDFCAECLEQECPCHRLQQLREEFETARSEATFGWDWQQQGPPPHSTEEWSRFKRNADWPKMSDVADLARRYIIARDFNEFDPGKADMLWKLQRQ